MHPERPTQYASYKRLICCADGTWLASDIGTRTVPSNVAKLARALSTEGIDDAGHIVPQVVQYQSGLGSGALPFQKTVAGSIGLGLDTDICQMYDFLANNYKDGDELFFFGFSRGAYTVRSVAGLVGDVGILPAVQMRYFPDMWNAYRQRRQGKLFKDNQWYMDHKHKLKLRDVKIKVIGVWETVGALGVPEWPAVKFLSNRGFNINASHAFHNTALPPKLEYAFQALALDEKRLTFPPSIWRNAQKDGPLPVLRQCWFPGVHADTGGQSVTESSISDHEELGYHSLGWMIDNLSGMLSFTDSAILELVHNHERALNNVNDKRNIHNGWGCGTIVDNFSGIEGLFFRLFGEQTRTPAQYEGRTEEFIHPLARIREQKLQHIAPWSPPSLKHFEVREPDGKHGWRWAKDELTVLPEWIMDNRRMSVRLGDNGCATFEWRKTGLSRLLCPPNVLRELDDGNKHVHRDQANGVHKEHVEEA